jgi:NAD(P)-dependent dehydrogenase (short-subunit alcohol dehydrogenase family)
MVDELRTAGPVLITGCSSGIGLATAIRLSEAGFTVVATARNPGRLGDLAERGIHTVPLDVTDENSMRAAVDRVEADHGPIAVLVNNAGYGLYGTVEQLPMEQIRAQFETNFFGLVRLTQLVLPAMRRARRGRILNVSSMGGRVTLPGGAFYHASKYAVEALSDALRMEVATFGIDVVLIEPGPVRTPFNDVAADTVTFAAGASGAAPMDGAGAGGDPYDDFKHGVVQAFSAAVRGPFARFSSSSDDVAAVIERAVRTDRPRTRYLINGVAHLMVGMRRMLPDRAGDAMLRRQYGIPG